MKTFRKKLFYGLLLFAAVLILTVVWDSRGAGSGFAGGSLAPATLPVLRAQYRGEWISPLYAAARELEPETVHGAVLPLPEDRRAVFSVSYAGADDASYEVWSSGCDRLIEKGDAMLMIDGVRQTLTCPLQNLYENGREYVLVLHVRTGGRTVHYYTRLRAGEGTHEEEMLSFARSFSDRTFDKEEAQALIPYLETRPTADTQTLDTVDIHSSFSQITWGDLAPIKSSETELTIAEMGDAYATYVLEYSVLTRTVTERSYRVRETATIRWSEVRCYIMEWSRTMEAELVPQQVYAGGTYLDLGIRPAEGCEAFTGEGGNYLYFTESGNLWRYDKKGSQLTNIFSFVSSGDSDLRETHDAHSVRIVAADADGNAEFVVYGYMNRGPHEGETGLAYYAFRESGREVEELFYIPSSRPYEVMKAELGKFFYVGENRVLYWLYRGGIYAVDHAGGEITAIAEGLTDSQMAVRSDAGAVAWENGTTPYNATQITVLYLRAGTSRIVEAAPGEYVKALGFLGDDFVCGCARASDVSGEARSLYPFPMYELRITDAEGTEVGSYRQPGAWVTGSSVSLDRITLQRAGRADDGSWTALSDDALVRTDASAPAEASSPLGTAQDKTRLRIRTLTIVREGSVKSISFSAFRRYIYREDGELRPQQTDAPDNRFYGYARGKLQVISSRIDGAVRAVTTDMGIVTDGSGRRVWGRVGRPAELEISLADQPKAETREEALAACLHLMILSGGGTGTARDLLREHPDLYDALSAAMPGRALDLTGLTVPQLIACQLPQKCPVAAFLSDGTPVLIVGYDAFNVTLYSPLEGRRYKMGQETAGREFAAGGSVFIGFLP